MSLTPFGVIGTVIAAIFCFTPVVAVLVGSVGLSWLIGYLDYVLFPALIGFVGITVYAVWRECAAIHNGEKC